MGNTKLCFQRVDLIDAFNRFSLYMFNYPLLKEIVSILHGIDKYDREISCDIAIDIYVTYFYLFEQKLQGVEISPIDGVALGQFMNSFDFSGDPLQAKWNYTEKYGGGKDHFNKFVVEYIDSKYLPEK